MAAISQANRTARPLSRAVLILAFAGAAQAFAQGTVPSPFANAEDRRPTPEAAGDPPAERTRVGGEERVVDITSLIRVVDEATESVAGPLVKTKLIERFREVNNVLRAERIDKVKLREALVGLEQELDGFVATLDSTPLFDAQESVGETIDKVRFFMATGTTSRAATPSERARRDDAKLSLTKQIEQHETQLRQLVGLIDREADPGRRERLKIMFAHHLRLKRLKERMASVDLSNTQMRVFARTVQALDILSTQLVSAGFRVEEARAVLAQQREFIRSYVAVVDGLIEAEELSAILRGIGSTGGKLSPVIGDLVEIAQQANEFSVLMEDVADGLMAEVDFTADTLQVDLDASKAELQLDIEAELKRYRNAGDTPSPVASPGRAAPASGRAGR